MEEDLFVKEDIRMEDKLVWKTIWVGRQTGMEDKLGGKTNIEHIPIRREAGI